jgi:hypothetical protein
MLQNKRFQSNESQEVVTITGDNGVFYSLSNGANIKKDIFFQKYSEMIDPASFLQQQSQAGLADLASQLRNVDSNRAVDGVIPPQVNVKQQAVFEQLQPPEEYKKMMLQNFEAEQRNKDLSQYKVFEDDEDAAADFERKIQQKQQQTQRQRPQYQDPYQQQPQQPQYQPQAEINVDGVNQVQQAPIYLSPEEEAFRFFKSFKKIYPIKLTVDFDEKIAEPNFIKMMAVNYEGDIIKFYTKEFMNRIYNDPGFLENKIYEKLKSLVFEEEQKKERKPRQPRQLTEGKEYKSNTKSVKSPKPNNKPPKMKKEEKDNG